MHCPFGYCILHIRNIKTEKKYRQRSLWLDQAVCVIAKGTEFGALSVWELLINSNVCRLLLLGYTAQQIKFIFCYLIGNNLMYSWVFKYFYLF